MANGLSETLRVCEARAPRYTISMQKNLSFSKDCTTWQGYSKHLAPHDWDYNNTQKKTKNTIGHVLDTYSTLNRSTLKGLSKFVHSSPGSCRPPCSLGPQSSAMTIPEFTYILLKIFQSSHTLPPQKRSYVKKTSTFKIIT